MGFLFPFAAFADSTVTASAGTGATVSPSGAVVVPTGVVQTFNSGAQNGYTLSNVSVDGVDQGDVSTVNFTGLAWDFFSHTIIVSATQVVQGGGQPYCSGPEAPGWNVSLPGGGCGSNENFIPYQHPVGDGTDCQFFMGCMVPINK